MLDLFTSIEDYGDTFHVKVTTKSASNRIKVEYLDNGTKLIKAYVTATPENGEANNAVIQLLAKELGIPKSKLKIIKGNKVRDKVVKVCK